MKRREEDHDPSGFGDLPDWYETEVGRAFSSATEPLLVDLIEAQQGERWLDAGAGTGRLARLLAALGAEVVAAEHDPGLLALAAARDPTITTVLADIENLPFEDESFDGATCVTVLEFVVDPAAALVELARVLSDEGPLVVGALQHGSLWGVGHRLRGWRSGAGSGYAHGAFVRPEDIDRLLTEAGLTPEGDWRRAIWWPPLGGPVGRLRRPIDAAGARLAPRRAAFMARRARRSAHATLA